MRRLLARISAAVLAFLLHDFCVWHLEGTFPDDEFMEAFRASTFDSWRRAHFLGFINPRHFVVLAKGRPPVLMTLVVGSDPHRTELASCTPWGILLEARRVRTALEVMGS